MDHHAYQAPTSHITKGVPTVYKSYREKDAHIPVQYMQSALPKGSYVPPQAPYSAIRTQPIVHENSPLMYNQSLHAGKTPTTNYYNVTRPYDKPLEINRHVTIQNETCQPEIKKKHKKKRRSMSSLSKNQSLGRASKAKVKNLKESRKKGKDNKKAAMIAASLKIFFLSLTAALTYLLYVKRKTFIPYATTAIDNLEGLGPMGPPIFSMIYAMWTTLLLPGEFLVLASGYVFTKSLSSNYWVGVAIGTVAVFGGLWLGGSVIFLAVKNFLPSLWRQKIERYDICKATLLAMDDGGILFLLLFRASPLVPFAISNVLLGMTNTSYLAWNIGLLGCLPAVLSSTIIGSQLNTIRDLFVEEGEQDHKGTIELLIVVLLPSFLCVSVAWFLVRKRMAEIKGAESDRGVTHWKTVAKQKLIPSNELGVEMGEYQPGIKV